MTLYLLLLMAVIILANLILITIMALQANRAMLKIEMFCDTLEKTLHNVLEGPTSKMDDIDKKLAQTEDHLRTINKNIYILASQIVRQEEQETE